MNKREETIQIELCNWIQARYPKVLFRSDGGGLRLPIGLAMKFKRIQKSRAWPDLYIAEARSGYHGLFIEIKASHDVLYRKDGTLRKSKHINEQSEVLTALKDRGFQAVFGVGFEGCVLECQRYLSEW